MKISYQILNYVCGLNITLLAHNFTKYKIDNNEIMVLANTKKIYYVLSVMLTFIGASGQ